MVLFLKVVQTQTVSELHKGSISETFMKDMCSFTVSAYMFKMILLSVFFFTQNTQSKINVIIKVLIIQYYKCYKYGTK